MKAGLNCLLEDLLMTKSILILDDEKLRHDVLSEILSEDICSCGEYAVHHAYDVEQAIKIADSIYPQLLYLDHDLGTTLNGRDFCQYLIKMKSARWVLHNLVYNPKIIIHSWNIDAAACMRKDLIVAGFTYVVCRPFKFHKSFLRRY